MLGYMEKNGTIVLPSIPSIGDRINIKHFGDAIVLRLFHNDINNFIEVEYKDILINQKIHKYCLEVRE
jgi:hypothetical protein